ncbi:DUF2273 domain-containing protein [Anaerococcus provencensis]|uniref:DUF2273 domain-containing protein n=1 Tax=Anaerococcus provencensis TaxID=938293 RepID=UPI0002FBE848|nr:DUF2273 domain-containing protein [Anaerococcus provencensis]
MNKNYEEFSDYQINNENSKIKNEKRDLPIKDKFRSFTTFHWNEFKYTLIGLIVSILFLTIGFFRTLLIIILYNIGNIYGKYKDGDPKTIFKLEKFFDKY